MIGELNIAGVFVPRLVIAFAVAFMLSLVTRRLLRQLNLYRFVWHAGLFDTALFFVTWWLIAILTVGLTPYYSTGHL